MWNDRIGGECLVNSFGQLPQVLLVSCSIHFIWGATSRLISDGQQVVSYSFGGIRCNYPLIPIITCICCCTCYFRAEVGSLVDFDPECTRKNVHHPTNHLTNDTRSTLVFPLKFWNELASLKVFFFNWWRFQAIGKVLQGFLCKIEALLWRSGHPIWWSLEYWKTWYTDKNQM